MLYDMYPKFLNVRTVCSGLLLGKTLLWLHRERHTVFLLQFKCSTCRKGLSVALVSPLSSPFGGFVSRVGRYKGIAEVVNTEKFHPHWFSPESRDKEIFIMYNICHILRIITYKKTLWDHSKKCIWWNSWTKLRFWQDNFC